MRGGLAVGALLLCLAGATDAPPLAVLEAVVALTGDATVAASWLDGEADPISLFALDFPRDGEVLPPSFDVAFAVQAGSEESLNRLYRDATLCVELNGAAVMCVPMMQSSMRLESLEVGTYTARAFIELDGARHRYTPPVSFSVVSSEDALRYVTQAAERLRRRRGIPADQDVLSWARSTELGSASTTSNPSVGVGSVAPALLIGVKSALQTNFHFRQAIRETWASSRLLPSDVRVVFIGCRPSLDGVDDPSKRSQLTQAIALEKQVFGDLLTDELDCDDSYDDLPRKVTEFIHWGVHHFESSLSYVMIADDDIYLRTDAFKQELLLLSDQRRLYAGQVWSKTFNRAVYSVRDATSLNYLPKENYPMQTPPPFALGAHFVLSVDCARFIAKNSHRLRGLAGRDDISVALWMLAIQVHPHHMPHLRSVRTAPCRDDVISYADLSPLGIRVVHGNLKAGQPFCTDFDSTVWRKPNATERLGNTVKQLGMESSLRDIRLSGVIEVATTVEGLDFSFIPSIETFAGYSNRVCKHLEQMSVANNPTCRQVREQLLEHHRSFYARTKAIGEPDASRTALWGHSLFLANPDSQPVYIGYTRGASFSHTLFECLFTSIYRSNPVIVTHIQTLAEVYDVRPDIPVFSIFDTACLGEKRCPARSQSSTNSQLNPSGRSIMFSGESWGTGVVEDDVLLVSTVSTVPQAIHHVYISMASASFAERLDHSPMDLLSSWTARKGIDDALTEPAPRRFCAFLYSQCDWPHRQYFYDVLNSLESVDAIGKCAGSLKVREQPRKLESRRSRWYLDDAVSQYEQFKFVIAFENSIAPGYVTEKVVNAFLAGAIPIFWGNSTSLERLFNPRSYIDCGAFSTLRQCAYRVIEVHRSVEQYEIMRKEPPIVDLDAFNAAFSWHPSVPSNASASAVAQHLFRQRGAVKSAVAPPNHLSHTTKSDP